jgi:molecular chaperone Hsp33
VTDRLVAFSFDDAPVRGRLVKLTETWARIRDRQPHAAAAERLLGEMVAIVAMLSHGIKFDGSVMLQIGGRGAQVNAMAECTDRTQLRAMLHGRVTTNDGDFLRLTGGGHLAITLRPHRGETYQGIVGIDAGSLVGAVEQYFVSSEQLPTRIWVVADRRSVAGLLLQRMPTRDETATDAEDDAWQRLQDQAGAATARDLLQLSAPHVLARLFGTEQVRMQAPIALRFGCSCSAARAAAMLQLLGRSEVEAIVVSEGDVTVTCEFCGSVYRYDPIDAHLLFEPLAGEYPATRQ